MFIVDAQVHIWSPEAPERPWPGGRSRPHRPQPFSKDDLLNEMDAAGVARVVIVPPSWEGDRNDLALEAARLHPDRFAVMGRPPIGPRPLDGWRDQPGILGLRVTSNTAEAQAWFDDPEASVWNEAERAALPVMISPSGLLRQADRIAQTAVRHAIHRLLMRLRVFRSAVRKPADTSRSFDGYSYPHRRNRI
jgi:L-fuconolactonase